MNTAISNKINAPLLYQLIDEHPDLLHEKETLKFIDVTELKHDIKNNLEKILNTRKGCFTWPKHFHDVTRSLLNYGIEDFSQMIFNNKQMQINLCQSIQKTIEKFEPRLESVKVKLIDSDQETERTLKIRIEGIMCLTSFSVSTVFESCLDMSRHSFDFEKDE